ncbi:MAG: hypothetical protein ACR2O3_01325 [Rhizobiaceae bacterium]
MRFILAKIRELCIAHSKIGNDSVRVCFVGYGNSSLDIEVRVYALTRQWNEFYAVQEDILLRIGELIDESASGFAFPSQTLYMARDENPDQDKGEIAIKEVEAWRKSGKLPFPNITPKDIETISDSLDYPPKGSVQTSLSATKPENESEPLSTQQIEEPQSSENNG